MKGGSNRRVKGLYLYLGGARSDAALYLYLYLYLAEGHDTNFNVKVHTIVYHYIRQYNNIDLSSEVSAVHKFVYTDEALLLVRQ